MKIILLRDVRKIGRKYEVKEVNDGFARNGLIGKGAALAATPDNLARLKKEIDQLAKTAAEREKLQAEGIQKIDGAVIELSGKANPAGHLFAAIHPREIAAALEKKTGVKIDPSWLGTKGIKEKGEHEIAVKIEKQAALFKVIVK